MSNEFEGGQEVESNWFKFTKVGDGVKGTLINKSFQKSNLPGYQDQWVYELKNSDGEIWNVGISAAKTGTIQRLNKCKVGQIIGIKFDSEGEAKKGFKPAKNLKVFTFGMDEAYLLAEQTDGEVIDPESVPFD